MGKKGIDIIKFDVKELTKLLNKALADEWLAYYQYWIEAQVVTGPTRDAVIMELSEHAADELRHAKMLAERITQLKGTPILDPSEWQKEANCRYLKPKNFAEKPIVTDALEGERCAIETYSGLLELIEDKDEVTYQIILEILKDEVKHEDDLEILLEGMS